MAKIETYPNASPVSGGDKLIGTDSINDNATKNFTISEIGNFVVSNYKNTYVHTQSTASDTWVIPHNKGFFPSVTLVDGSNNVIYSDVSYQDQNEVVVTFSVPVSGKAYLN